MRATTAMAMAATTAMAMAMALAIGCGARSAPQPEPTVTKTVIADELIGLWGDDIEFDVGPHGPLRVTESAGRWRAVLGAIDAPLAIEGDAIVGDVGTGKLRLRRAGKQLAGHWIQPKSIPGPSYASPIVLVADGAGAFRGTVEPRSETVHLYLAISRAGAEMRAFVREHGHNLGKQFGVLTVTRAGDAVTLRDSRGKVQMRGTLAAGRLRLEIERMGMELDLTRRGRDAAPNFYPRPSSETTYRYRAPRDLGDGWRVGTLDTAQLAAEPIHALARSIIDAVPAAVTSPAIHGLVIARRGVLVVDEYFSGHRADLVHDTRSAGKSFSTTLAGIAIDRRAVTLTTPLYAATGVAPDDPRKQAITLEHLLTMSTGLACDDRDEASPGEENRMQSGLDWVGHTLALPVTHPAGAHAAYCSGTLNLIGAVLVGRTGAWLPERLHRDLMAPLDIDRYYVNLQPDGQAYLGGGLQLRTRDFAKLAQLFLDRGRWRGKQIVSAAWVDAATAPHASLNGPDDYGYGWWRRTYRVGNATYDAFYASGNGGQLAIAIPALDLVIAFQSGNYGDYGTWRRFAEELVPKYVIAAAQPGAGATTD